MGNEIADTWAIFVAIMVMLMTWCQRVLGCHRDIGRLLGAKLTFPGRLKQTENIKCTSLLRDTSGYIPCWINLPTLTAQSRERGWDAGLLGGPGGCRRLVGALHMSLCPLHCVATLPWQPVTTPGLMIHPEWCNMRTWKTSRLPRPSLCVTLPGSLSVITNIIKVDLHPLMNSGAKDDYNLFKCIRVPW